MSLRPIPVVLLALFALPAPAAVLTVGASGCDHLTLSAAISAAQPGDELRLREQTFTGVSVSIDKSLTIRGGYVSCGDPSPGLGSNSVLEGSGASRLISIGGGATTTVGLINVELTGGGNETFGGAIAVLADATLRIATVDIYGNAADFGGAIHVGAGAILEHAGPVTLRDNSATRGGAIYVSANGEADFSTGGFNPVDIFGNQAQFGGGVYLDDGSVLRTDAMRSLSIENNQAQGGGGLFIGTSALVGLEDARIVGNLAAVAGGGVFVAGDGTPPGATSIVFDRDTEIRDNLSQLGGGVAFGLEGGFDARIDAKIRGNEALLDGGGLYVASAGQLDLASARFNDNLAGRDGGGLFASDAQVEAGAPVFSGNRAEQDGGAFALDLASRFGVNLQLSLFANEAGRSGGGASIRAGAVLAHGGSPLTGAPQAVFAWNNVAETGDGGAFHVADAGVELIGAWIGTITGSGNRAPVGRGGGVYIDTDQDWFIRDSWINGNRADAGGGLYILGGANFELGGFPAGSIPPRGPNPPCDPFELDPGRYCAEVRGNVANFAGGALVVADDTPATRLIRDLAILENQGGTPAAGVYSDVPDLRMENVLLARHADTSALFVLFESGVTLEQVSFLYNDRAFRASGGITATVNRSIFWGNGLDFSPGGGSATSGTCNLSKDSRVPGRSTEHPRFITNDRGLYRLSNESGALDACADGMRTADLDGVARPDGAGYDLGAFEGAWGTSDVLLRDSFESGPAASPALPIN